MWQKDRINLGVAVDGDQQLGIARGNGPHFAQVHHAVADLSDAQDVPADAQSEQYVRR